MIVARSYASAYRLRDTLTHLCLSSSSDVACINLMCSRVTFGCACRLAQVLDHFSSSTSSSTKKTTTTSTTTSSTSSSLSTKSSLKVIEIAQNKLSVLPSSIWNCKSLERVDASGNLLEDLGITHGNNESLLSSKMMNNEKETVIMENLEEVDLRNNTRLSIATVKPLLLNTKQFPKLTRVLLDKNIGEEGKVSQELYKLSPSKVHLF